MLFEYLAFLCSKGVRSGFIYIFLIESGFFSFFNLNLFHNINDFSSSELSVIFIEQDLSESFLPKWIALVMVGVVLRYFAKIELSGMISCFLDWLSSAVDSPMPCKIMFSFLLSHSLCSVMRECVRSSTLGGGGLVVIIVPDTSEDMLTISVMVPSFSLSTWKVLANSHSCFLVSNTTSSRCLIAVVIDSTAFCVLQETQHQKDLFH